MKITIVVIAMVMFIWLYCLLGANKQRNKAIDKSRTNYDRIKNASIEEMAEYIYSHDDELNDKICKSVYKVCPYGEGVMPEQCQECVKNGLRVKWKRPKNKKTALYGRYHLLTCL